LAYKSKIFHWCKFANKYFFNESGFENLIPQLASILGINSFASQEGAQAPQIFDRFFTAVLEHIVLQVGEVSYQADLIFFGSTNLINLSNSSFFSNCLNL
jgi:hypothetical protein